LLGRRKERTMTSAPAGGLTASPSVTAAARIPVSFFSIVMGIAGLGAAWRAASQAYKVSAWFADALLAISVALWLALLAAQVAKALTARERLRAELEHPVDGSLAALAPAALLLLTAGIAVHSRSLAAVLFWIGAAGQLAFAVYVVGRWFMAPIEPSLVTPALYIPPVVGSFLAALAAGSVGRADAGWLFFGAGAIVWLLVAATLLGRYLSAGELAAPLRPLLGIELAPPAVGLTAWQVLDGPFPDATTRILLGFSLLVALVLLRLVGRFRDVQFGAAYWAFTFPLAALSTATLREGGVTPGSFAAGLALPIFVVVNAIVAVIAFRTVTAAARGTLLARE
jgi:tellurite resistance protein